MRVYYRYFFNTSMRVVGNWKWVFFPPCSWSALVAGVGGCVLTGLVKTIGFGVADKEKLERLAAQVGGKRGKYLYAADGDGGEELKQCFQYAAE